MKLKIFRNFYITTGFILFITLTLMFVIMSVALNGNITNSRHNVLDKSVNSVVRLIDEAAPSDELKRSMITVSDVNDLDIFVSDSAGNVLFCSCSESRNNGSCIDTKNLIGSDYLNGITEDVSFGLSTMNGRYENMRYVSGTKYYLKSKGEYYYIFASATTVTVTQMLSSLFKTYAFVAILPLLFMFMAEYILTSRLAKPLKYMSAAAKSIAKGDYSKRVPVTSDDEIGELSVLFNRMTDSLSKNEMVRRNFVSNVSHELKTPMTTIGGFIDGMLDGTIDQSRHEYYLRIVSEEVKRLSRLVASMLSIARLESDERVIRPSEFDFAELALSVVLSMEQKITNKRLKLSGFDSLTHTVITADKDLIYQVVYNLFDNAIKYSNDKGFVKFSSHRIGDYLEFKIVNDGRGIPKEDIPYVFERFYKTDKARSGNKDSLGLGLYITKTIIDIHDGDISVKSELGEYTEFKVRLPIKK